MYNFHVKEWASYFVGEVRVYVHNGKGHEYEIISRIKEDNLLKKCAEQMGKDANTQKEANHLISELLKGNSNPGIHTKTLFKGVRYLRGRNGARIFYRKTAEAIEILGKANKKNEQTVIDVITKLYG